jgi:mannose-6-phosphate isomerase-like protein (cupin superfamily)
MKGAILVTAGTVAILCAMAVAQQVGQPGRPMQMQVKSEDGAVMRGFVGNIENLTDDNSNFRQVLYTGRKLQLVLMTLKPGEEIGEEVHADSDQFFRIEKGKGEVRINGGPTKIKAGDAVLVPAGARHNIVNTGGEPLRLYTLYAPPQHRDGTVHATKVEAEGAKEHFDGNISE